MSRRAAGVLWFGLGTLVSPLIGIGSVLVAELLQRWNMRSAW